MKQNNIKKFIHDCFLKDDKILDFLQKKANILAIIILTLLALIVRVAGFGFQSGDYIYFIKPWIIWLKENGGIMGIGKISANYTPPSLLLYGLISYLPEKAILWAVKIVSCFFDFVIAFFSYKIIKNFTNDAKKSIFAYYLVLFCPTVFLNSGIWGQCDSIYTAFCVMSFFYFLKNKPHASLFFFGIALSFKLQAIFSLPFFVFMYFYRKWSLKQIFFAIYGFFVINIPLCLFGVSPIKWAKVYWQQLHEYSDLVLNTPTIYAIIPMNDKIGIILAVSILAIISFVILSSKTTIRGGGGYIQLLFYLTCTTVFPFILPHMHERYFYMADVFVILYVITNPKKWVLAVLIIFPSIITYTNYLYGKSNFSLQILTVIMGIGVLYIQRELLKSIGIFNMRSYSNEKMEY
jgi:Gpi18-like mannosyltransferase